MKAIVALFVLALYGLSVWCLGFPRAFNSYLLKPRFPSRGTIEPRVALAIARAVGIIALLTAAFLTYASLKGAK
jgi:hypothetical protein